MKKKKLTNCFCVWWTIRFYISSSFHMCAWTHKSCQIKNIVQKMWKPTSSM